MTKKVDSSSGLECQGNRTGHKHLIITGNYNLDFMLLNPLSDSSGIFPTSLPPTNFDTGSEELELSKLSGYIDCRNCYFRRSTIKRMSPKIVYKLTFRQLYYVLVSRLNSESKGLERRA